MCIFTMIHRVRLLLVLATCLLASGQTPSSTLTPDNTQSNSLLNSAFPPNVNDKQRKEILQAFESSLLTLFGLKQRPRPSADIKIPQYLLDLYAKYSQDPDALGESLNAKRNGVSGNANTVRSFFHKETHEGVVQMNGCSKDNCAKFLFNVTSVPPEEVLTGAELRLFMEQDPSANDSIGVRKQFRHRIEVHEIMHPASKNNEAITRLIDVKHVTGRNASWESFDIHPAVLKWKKTPHLNHGIEVRVLPYKNKPSQNSIKHVRLRRAAELSNNEWHTQRPLLVTYSDDNRGISRTKRDTNRKKKNIERRKKKQKRRRRRNKKKKNRKNKTRRRKLTDQCKRKPLYVDFTQVGWNDWIFAPPGYQAYYCHGSCHWPYSDHMNVTNHAIVQDLVNSIDPSRAPKPCCVPTELSSISLLYTDQYGTVVLKTYQDMVVQGCGCR